MKFSKAFVKTARVLEKEIHIFTLQRPCLDLLTDPTFSLVFEQLLFQVSFHLEFDMHVDIYKSYDSFINLSLFFRTKNVEKKKNKAAIMYTKLMFARQG